MPNARIARDEGVCWLGEALAAPGFHLLLCGRLSDRDARQLVAVRRCYASRLTVHHLTCDARPGRCRTSTGKRSRGSVKETAQYLIRPDGHIGYRCAGTDLDGLRHYLAHWLPNPTPHPA